MVMLRILAETKLRKGRIERKQWDKPELENCVGKLNY